MYRSLVAHVYSSSLADRRTLIAHLLSSFGCAYERQSFVLDGYVGENILVNSLATAKGPNIIVSAHYDGWGAYDNAGGTVALVWLTRFLAESNLGRRKTPPGVFVVFLDGEESGLLGARHFAASHRIDHEDRIIGHVSLDGFGAGTHIGGFGNVRKIALEDNAGRTIDFVLQADTTVFQECGTSSLHLFSLPHAELRDLQRSARFPETWRLIHTPSDTPDRLKETYLPYVALHLFERISTLNFNIRGIFSL